MNARVLLLPAALLLCSGAVILLDARSNDSVWGARRVEAAQPHAEPTADAAVQLSDLLVDRPLATYQVELLDLAFKSASVLPAQPHIKSRSRAQDGVVAACLELGQPLRALRDADAIGNWRRAAGYADIALYCARNGLASGVEHCVELARQHAATFSTEKSQDWQRARIEQKIARAQAQLAHDESFDLDARLRDVAAIAASGDFDEVRAALDECTELYDRKYADAAQRGAIQRGIEASWTKLAIALRVELVVRLAEIAVEHADRAQATELVARARELVGGASWSLEQRLPIAARMAQLRHEIGESDDARRELDEALALYDANEAQIQSAERAAPLRAIARAYQTIGARERALAVAAKALEAGAVNPNGRPRAEDLSATCRAMALSAIEPDEATWKRMHAIYAGLKQPW